MSHFIKAHWQLIAILLATLAGAWLCFSEVAFEALEFTGDNYTYLELARSLSEGNGYATRDGENWIPSNWFPPGYSVFLLVAQWASLDNPLNLKWLNLGLLVLGWTALVFSLVRNSGVSKTTALVAGVLMVTNWQLLGWANRVMSEMLFWSLTALAIVAFQKFRAHFKWKSWSFLALIVCLAAAYYTRGNGIALVMGVLLSLAVSRQWKASLLLVLGFALLVAPWSIRNASHGLKGRYLNSVITVNPWDDDAGDLVEASQWLEKLEKNAYDTTIRGFLEVSFPGLPFPEASTPWMWTAGALFLLVCLWGIAQWKGLGWVIGGYLGASITIFMLWHSGNGARYVWPLSPLLMLGCVSGMFDLGKRTLGRMGASYNWVPFLALAMMFWSKSGYDSAKARQATPLSPGQLDYLALSDTLNTLAQPADLAVVRKPEITRNLAHVRCITFPYTKDSLEMMQFFAKHKPQFILIDNDAGFTQSAKFLVPFLNAHRQLWSVLVQKQQGNSSSYLLKYNAEKGQALWESWQAAPDADTP